jgi:hypothetical protein
MGFKLKNKVGKPVSASISRREQRLFSARATQLLLSGELRESGASGGEAATWVGIETVSLQKAMSLLAAVVSVIGVPINSIKNQRSSISEA